jgi:putative holliday junction resolvase
MSYNKSEVHMMRTAALDLGDVWIGVALADPLGISARPHETVRAEDLTAYIATLMKDFQVGTIVVGHPQTLQGTASAQTLKIEEQFHALQKEFPTLTWALWDERLTSKQASHIKPAKNKEQKQQQHAIAAALILQSYLERQAWIKKHTVSGGE